MAFESRGAVACSGRGHGPGVRVYCCLLDLLAARRGLGACRPHEIGNSPVRVDAAASVTLTFNTGISPASG
jgi:hypothetical protein